MSEIRKFTMSLPESELESIRFMAETSAIPHAMTQVVREALATERILYEATQNGEHLVLIHRETGEERHISFPRLEVGG